MNIVPVKPEDLVPLKALTLVIGGARSGKSAFAEVLVAAHAAHVGCPPIYLATGEACDAEMAERIRRHRERRGAPWRTVEAPRIVSLADLPAGAPVVFDCLTLWLTNLMLARADVETGVAALLAGFRTAPGPVVVVGNDVGAGIVPDTPLARAFRDHAGELNQRVAAAATGVILMTAGLPLVLKSI
ncbi:MAG: adenosylcobinamide kinase / adenosylcobinamide-phosphate guanylyltransferase [Rhodospirillaceae bacterium]|nr:MAG: adenosylcobinamide kinase / adenosylcobinamide-phosphate guanylyltransferase [Rhodospirillaceae bacterium]